MASVISNTSLASVKQSTHQCHLVFTHALSSQANTPIRSRHPTIWTTYINSENGFTENEELIKALPNLPIFPDKKNPSIDQ